MPEQNRESRRRDKFGGGRAAEHGGWPTTQPNPIFGGEEDAPAAANSELLDDSPVAEPDGPIDEPGDLTPDKASPAGS